MPRQGRAPGVLPARQARSERTRDRILDAAESLLKRRGPDAATVPAIASAAGVAVGSVYRRFADKDAVLRGVYERFLTRTTERNREALAMEPLLDLPLSEVVPLVVRGMVRGYEQEPALLAALMEYAERQPNSDVRRRADALRESTFAAVEQLLLKRRGEIGHPDPPAAIHFLLWTIGLVLKGMLLQGKRIGITIAAEQVGRELETMALRYLGIRPAPHANST